MVEVRRRRVLEERLHPPQRRRPLPALDVGHARGRRVVEGEVERHPVAPRDGPAVEGAALGVRRLPRDVPAVAVEVAVRERVAAPPVGQGRVVVLDRELPRDHVDVVERVAAPVGRPVRGLAGDEVFPEEVGEVLGPLRRVGPVRPLEALSKSHPAQNHAILTRRISSSNPPPTRSTTSRGSSTSPSLWTRAKSPTIQTGFGPLSRRMAPGSHAAVGRPSQSDPARTSRRNRCCATRTEAYFRAMSRSPLPSNPLAVSSSVWSRRASRRASVGSAR